MTASNNLRAIILGSGSSGGVPRFGGPDGAGDWGTCDPNEPKNRRSRCSLLLERTNEEGAKTSVLIDTSPDMRYQLLDARCGHLDAVLFTHHHADQCHGIDDLRVFAISQRARIPVFIDEATGTIHDLPWDALEVRGLDGLEGFEVHDHQVVLRGSKR